VLRFEIVRDFFESQSCNGQKQHYNERRNIRIIGGGCKGGSTIGRTKSDVVITAINNIDLNPKTFLINANDQLET
jgi:hypothetical protein